MNEQDKIKEEIALCNNGMVPSRYYCDGQNKALDSLRDLISRFEIGDIDDLSFCQNVNKIIIAFESGPVKSENWNT